MDNEPLDYDLPPEFADYVSPHALAAEAKAALLAETMDEAE